MPEFTQQHDAGHYSKALSIGSGTAAAARTVKLKPELGLSVALALTSGTPSTGATVLVTNSPYADIESGDAIWVQPSGITALTGNQIYTSNTVNGCQLTGVRASVTDGTWSMHVRQA